MEYDKTVAFFIRLFSLFSFLFHSFLCTNTQYSGESLSVVGQEGTRVNEFSNNCRFTRAPVQIPAACASWPVLDLVPSVQIKYSGGDLRPRSKKPVKSQLPASELRSVPGGNSRSKRVFKIKFSAMGISRTSGKGGRCNSNDVLWSTRHRKKKEKNAL